MMTTNNDDNNDKNPAARDDEDDTTTSTNMIVPERNTSPSSAAAVNNSTTTTTNATNNNINLQDDLQDDERTNVQPSMSDDLGDNNNNNNNNNEHNLLPAEAAVARTGVLAYLVVDEEEERHIEIAQAEKVKPFFQRKEGQLTIVIVGLLVASVAILVGVFATRQDKEEGDGGDDNGVLANNVVPLPSDVPSLAPSFDLRPTLTIVRDRGVVNCGIEDSSREGDVNLAEYNIDQCRAVAATIFGNPTRMNLVIVGKDDRYERLTGRELDVLFAGDTFTLERLIREVRNNTILNLFV